VHLVEVVACRYPGGQGRHGQALTGAFAGDRWTDSVASGRRYLPELVSGITDDEQGVPDRAFRMRVFSRHDVDLIKTVQAHLRNLASLAGHDADEPTVRIAAGALRALISEEML
jgi:hypothetical protein